MLTPDVELVFGVAGEGRADSESYNLIASHLKSITRHLAKNKIPFIQIHIDNKQFTEEIKKIQKKLKELQKTVNIPVNIKENTGKESSNSKSKSSDNVKRLKEEKEIYNQLKKSINEAQKAKQSYFKSLAKGTSNNKLRKASGSIYDGVSSLANESAAFGKISEVKLKDLKDLDDKNQIENKKKLREELEKTELQYGKLVDKARQYIETAKDAGVMNTEAGRKAVENLQYSLNQTVNFAPNARDTTKLKEYGKHIKDITKDLNKLKVETSTNPDVKLNALDKLKNAFGNKFWSMLSGALISSAARALMQVYNNVVKLDEAVTNLQIATGKSREETKELVKDYSKLAVELGATTTEVAEAADNWLRQGYSIEETNELIRNSMMLSKLGQLESADATKALTSAIKGYAKDVSEAERIVDKFTAVDMKAAIGAGDIATAMAETATSANIAGVSMDTLIGYIATVGEVTQDGAESVGTFFKTLFARMGNIKSGKFVDDETGEALNDVESVLGNIGIVLRDSKGEFRDFDTVLEETAAKWENLNTVEQHAVATAMAGTRQQEKFMVLMENYGTALEYATVSAESAGTASEKYQEAYMSSIEASMNGLTAAWQAFSNNLINSDLVVGFINIIKIIAQALNGIIAFGNGFAVKGAMIIGLVFLIKVAFDKLKKSINKTFGEGTLSTLNGFISVLKDTAKKTGTTLLDLLKTPTTYLTIFITLMSTIENKGAKLAIALCAFVGVVVAAIVAGIKSIDKTTKSFMAKNPIGWIVLGLTAIITAIKAIVDLLKKPSYEDLKEIAQESKEAWEGTNEELSEVQDNIKSITEKIEELESKGQLSLVDSQELAQYKQDLAALQSQEEKLQGDNERAMKQALQDAEAAKNKYGSTHTKQYNKGWALAGRITAGVLTLGMSEFAYRDAIENSETYEEKFNRILNNYSGASSDEKSYVSNYLNEMKTIVEGFTYKTGSDISATQKEMNAQLDEYYDLLEKYHAKEGNFATVWSSVFGRAKYEEATKALTELANNIEATEDNLRDLYNSNENGIGDFIDRLIEIGMFSWNDTKSIKSLVQQIRDLATISGNAATSYSDMLNTLSQPYDTISQLLEDVKESGVISGDNISELFKDNAVLAEALKNQGLLFETEDGYSIQDDSLAVYFEELQEKYKQAIIDAENLKQKIKEAYGEDTKEYEAASESLKNAQENLKTFLVTLNTLDKPKLIEEYTEFLEKMSDGLDEQLDKTKAIYDMRKDLLESYKEELDYQNELAKKQNSVADLSTKLAIAKLDGSATGQAKVRELEKELAEAQEELDEYTLDKAIEDLSATIDSEYDEYSQFIDKQVKSITDAIDNAASKTTEELRNLLGKTGEVKQHHTGGFVGSPKLKDNEEFAKLLDGELVVTSQQMSRFMNKTLPEIRQIDGGNIVSYNAPLVEINCENVNNETMPQLEKLVDKAVTRVKKEIDNSLTRKGYKKPTDKFAF